jgi:hypothetical protein
MFEITLIEKTLSLFTLCAFGNAISIPLKKWPNKQTKMKGFFILSLYNKILYLLLKFLNFQNI